MARRASLLVIALVLLVAACGGDDESRDTTTPPTTTEAPTTTDGPTTTLAPTTAPPSTTTSVVPTTAAPDEGPLDFAFEVVRTEGNESLPDGDAGEWDSRWAFAPWVVLDDGVFHMFYTGWGDDGLGIGYATSANGLDFEEHPANPIVDLMPGDDGAVDAGRAIVRILEDGTWEMFIGEWVDLKTQGTAIWRATAESPTGPWAISKEPIYRAEKGKWDSRVVPQAFIPGTDNLLYDGVRLQSIATGLLLADAGGWAPFDDPATDASEFDTSDPVLAGDPDGRWDAANVASPIVFATADGYEMFYSGWAEPKTVSAEDFLWLGYATSDDGVAWERYEANPAIEMTNENGWLWMSGLKVDDVYHLYFAIQAGKHGIGVVTGTITD